MFVEVKNGVLLRADSIYKVEKRTNKFAGRTVHLIVITMVDGLTDRYEYDSEVVRDAYFKNIRDFTKNCK